jgi:indolepyruvate ferredoxin oxidoreductase alpha subunit
MGTLELNQPGKTLLMMGDEAIARGAIEAGVDFCAAYPGTPSTEIPESLARVAQRFNIYVEWSTNEIVALEVAAAASIAGLRALVAMKQPGVNVCADFLMAINLTGTNGGLVLAACDDPSAISSSNEQDSRSYARYADLPLLEPADFQEAGDVAVGVAVHVVQDDRESLVLWEVREGFFHNCGARRLLVLSLSKDEFVIPRS